MGGFIPDLLYDSHFQKEGDSRGLHEFPNRTLGVISFELKQESLW